MKIKIKVISNLFIAILVLTGCSEVASVKILPDTDEIFMNVGDALNIPAEVSPDDIEISYRSSDESVVYYRDDLVYALSPGISVIYVRAGGVTSNFITIHVRDFEEKAESGN